MKFPENIKGKHWHKTRKSTHNAIQRGEDDKRPEVQLTVVQRAPTGGASDSTDLCVVAEMLHARVPRVKWSLGGVSVAHSVSGASIAAHWLAHGAELKGGSSGKLSLFRTPPALNV